MDGHRNETASRTVPGSGGQSWRVDAVCAQTDPEAFFPETGGSTRDAKRVCGLCPVMGECLEWALANDVRFGVWGGLSAPQRTAIRRRRRAEPAAGVGDAGMAAPAAGGVR